MAGKDQNALGSDSTETGVDPGHPDSVLSHCTVISW
jgi:hypothetical protein